jgi:hypothetical protein
MIDTVVVFWCYTFIVSLAGIQLGWWMRGAAIKAKLDNRTIENADKASTEDKSC